MAYKFGISFETLDPDRRDQFLESLLDLIDEHRRGADTAVIKLTHEIITGSGGKRKITDEQTIEPGQPMPDLAHFGQPSLTPMERIDGFAAKHGARVEFSPSIARRGNSGE